MSHKLKLGVALVVVALALPTIAAAQDPSTRTDLTIIGAVSTENVEQIADTHAVPTPDAPVVYEDASPSSATANDEAETSIAAATDLGNAVEAQ